MADAFRGLTLKLGADARPVQSAISSIARSASQAQSQLNKMNKALRFDSTNAAALASRIDLAGDKASHMARSAVTIRTALAQAGKQAVAFSQQSGIAGGRLDKVANSTKDAYAQTQKLLAEYNHVDTELAHIYEAAARVAKVDMGFKKLEDAREHVKQLRRDMSGLDEPMNEARAALESYVRVASMEGGLAEKFGFSKTFGDAKKLVNVMHELRSEQKRLQADMDGAKAVDGYRAMRLALIEYKSGLREAAAEAARFKAEMYATGSVNGLANAVSYAQRLDPALERATADARQFAEAFRAAPGSIETARAKLATAAQATEALKAKAEALRGVIAKIEGSPGFDRQAMLAKDAYVAYERAEQSVAGVGAKLKAAQEAASAFNAEMKEAGTSAARYQELESKLAKVNAAITRLKVESSAADAELEQMAQVKRLQETKAQLAAVNTELASLKSKSGIGGIFAGAGNALREMGYGLYSTVTPAIMMAGRYAIQAANDIDSAYRDMRKTVNGTEEQFEHLKQAAIEFSQTHVTSADAMLEIEAIGGQLGIAAGDLEAFARTVSNLDIATNMDTEDIALDLAKLANIMHFGQEQYDAFADSLVRLGNNEPALESDIMAISMRFAGMAANVGMATSDVLGLATAATATGQKAEAAGGSIQRTIGRIEAAVAEGGEELQAYADISGMSAEEFASTWGDTGNHGPIRAVQAFIEGLKNVRESGGSVISSLNELGITGVRDRQLISGLTNTTDVLAESLQMSGDAWNGLSTAMSDGSIERAGDAAREAERKSEGFSGELGKMQNNAKALAETLSEGATPIIHDIGGAFKDLTSALRETPAEFKTFAVTMAGIVALAGPMGVWAGTTVNFFSNISKAAKKAQGAMELGSVALQIKAIDMAAGPAATSMTKMGKALEFVSKPGGMLAIAGIALAIGKVTEAVVDYMEHTRNAEVATRGVYARMGIAAQQAAGIAEEGSMRVAQALNFKPTHYDWVENLASTFDSLQKKAEDTFANNALISQYADRIAEFMRLAEESESHILNKQQQAELRAAVDAYNDATGESIEITDAERAKLKDSQDQAIETAAAFERLAEKKRIAAMQDYLNEEYAEKYKAMREGAENLADAEQKLADLRRERAQIDATGINFDGEAVSAEAEYYKLLEAAIARLEEETGDSRASLDGLKKDLADTSDLQIIMAKAASDAGTALDSMLADVEGLDIAAYMSHSNKSLLEFADALDSCGEKAQGLGYDKVLELAKDWDGTLASIMPRLAEYGVALDGLEKVQIGGKEFYVTDNGSIFDQEGLLAAFDGVTIGDKDYYVSDDGSVYDAEQMVVDFDSVKIGDKRYIVTDQGTLYDAEGKLASIRELQIGDKTYYVSSKGTVYDEIGAIGKLENTELTAKFVEVGDKGTTAAVRSNVNRLRGEISGLPGYTDTIINSNAPEVTGEVNGTYNALKSIDGLKSTATINVRDNASGVLNGIASKIAAIARAHTASVNGVQQAAGGINDRLVRAIPMHADGAAINGIVKQATLTNAGLVGEAGSEALLRMGHRTAVVPLSNRRYVRPFARAVAAEMGGGARNVTNNITVRLDYRAGEDAAQLAEDLARELSIGNLLGV